MKKMIFGLATAAVLAGGLGSCKQGTSAKLSNGVDSASFAFGQQQGSYFSQFIENAKQRGGVDFDAKELLRGIEDGLADTTQFSYAQGVLIGSNLAKSAIKEFGLNKDVFYAAFSAAANNDSTALKFTSEVADSLARTFEDKARQEKLEKEHGPNKKAGEEYIEKFKKEHPEAKTTESGLVYVVKEEGKGESPTDGAEVTVNYEGKLIDGTVFDSSFERKEPATFNIGQVIPGWTEMLKLMKPGEKVTVVIPQNLAYGAQDMQKIKPFSTLVFDIDLISVKNESAK